MMRRELVQNPESSAEEGLEERKALRPTKTALMHASDLLARQEHSSKLLAEKLLRKGHEEREVAEAIAKLTAAHYLDDEAACARQFAMLYEESRKSVREICVKLVQRGFDRALVAGCVPQDIYERELRAATASLRVKYRREQPREKMLQYLYRHGFSTSVSCDAYAAWKEEEA